MPGAASPGSDSHGGALGGSRTATVAAQAAGVNIVYVDVTAEFAGHGIGSKKPFINSDGVGAYHPKRRRLPAYAKAIFAAIRSAWLDDNKQVA
jgi:hypothetical protein